MSNPNPRSQFANVFHRKLDELAEQVAQLRSNASARFSLQQREDNQGPFTVSSDSGLVPPDPLFGDAQQPASNPTDARQTIKYTSLTSPSANNQAESMPLHIGVDNNDAPQETKDQSLDALDVDADHIDHLFSL